MINRILATLDSPRRHLTFLVSLLVLVFVLTGLVAHRAIESERSRSEQAAATIERGMLRAAGEWASYYHMATTGAVAGIAWNVVTPLLNSAVTADAVAEVLPNFMACDFCTDTLLEAETVFTMDVATRRVTSATGSFDSDLASAAIDVLLADTTRRFNDHTRGLVYVGRTDRVHNLWLVGILQPETEAVESVVGILLKDESALDMLDATFIKAQELTGAATVVESVDSLYDRAALVGGVPYFGKLQEGGSENYPGPPVHGITFSVNLREAAAFGRYNAATRGLAIVGIMILIGGLLVVALLQIRRETMLMRLRADFVSSVSHELRTPLAQIRMFVETLLLGRTRSDVERHRSLEIIEQEARRLSHLVENVLLFSKTEGGRTPRIAPEATDFAGDIRRAVDSFSLISRSRDAEIRTELQENITVQVDRGALRQMLINLIDNALKYGPNGQRVTVGAALFDDVARVWVDDEGPGIPAEHRQRVFESFYRIQRDRQTHVAGSGIGLAVVRELARLHEGEVWAEDAPGGGARIVVQFPDAYLRSDAAGNFAAAS